MPEPKQRHTKSRRNRRRSQIKIQQKVFSICPKCKQRVLPHQMCPNCGYYKGRQVIDVLAKLEKRERKQKEKEIKESEKEKVSEKSLTMEDLSKK
ncbi:MAG: 50S ribosomal protein L32 [Candidatus Pacebacteria bacterium]|nr:50S ribosomal protein L32 [Candidatus Paceibacterota bacterium]